MNLPALARLELAADCARCGRLVPVEQVLEGGAGQHPDARQALSNHRCQACGGAVTRLRLEAGAR